MNTSPSITIFFEQWNEVLKSRSFRIEFLITLVALYGLMIFSQVFFASIEVREGKLLHDFILSEIPPRNMSWVIFPIIYVSILVALCNLSLMPQVLLRTLQAYFFLTALRLTCIYFIPLNPPAGLVLLRDPLIDYFVYDENVITKDLFFSGHTSSLFLFYLVLKNPKLKILLLLCTFVVAALILVQHAHYSIDILAAPLFAWFSWNFIKFLTRYNKTLPSDNYKG